MLRNARQNYTPPGVLGLVDGKVGRQVLEEVLDLVLLAAPRTVRRAQHRTPHPLRSPGTRHTGTERTAGALAAARGTAAAARNRTGCNSSAVAYPEEALNGRL
jgi:hypothetical protein